MYSLKPVNELPARVPLPDAMYRLPRIQGGPRDSGRAARQEVDDDVNALEHRQMSILKELCELKQQVEYLWVAARLSDVVRVPPYVRDAPEYVGVNSQTPVDAQIVVFANPSSPPYFVLALQRIWKDTRFDVLTHRHSSVINVATRSFEEKLLSKLKENVVHNVDVKLIWKDVDNVQLVTKVYDYPLEGEANILRYLARLVKKYNYEDSESLEKLNEIDYILNYCLTLPYEETRRINAAYARFAALLDKSQWFLNSTSPTIVDIAVWSAIKNTSHNKVPTELKTWYDSCEKLFFSN